MPELKTKPDWAEAQERYKRWWAREDKAKQTVTES